MRQQYMEKGRADPLRARRESRDLFRAAALFGGFANLPMMTGPVFKLRMPVDAFVRAGGRAYPNHAAEPFADQFNRAFRKSGSESPDFESQAAPANRARAAHQERMP